MVRSIGRSAGAAAVAAVLAAGCSDPAGTGEARLTVLLTDIPAAYLSAADVTIGKVSILPVDGPAVVLTEDGGPFNLLELQNGVTASLASLTIEAGFYHQLRLEVLTASVTLADGLAFVDGATTMDLKVPSGASSGLKINLAPADGDNGENGDGENGDGEDGGIEITGDMILVVDFDVQQSFVIQGNPNTPAGIRGVLFKPLLRAVVSDVAGTISGVVTDGTDPLPGLTVSAVLQSSEVQAELQTTEATATTGDDGSYTIEFLAPGTYEVSVVDSGVDPVTVSVGEGEDVTEIDFVVPPSSP